MFGIHYFKNIENFQSSRYILHKYQYPYVILNFLIEKDLAIFDNFHPRIIRFFFLSLGSQFCSVRFLYKNLNVTQTNKEHGQNLP